VAIKQAMPPAPIEINDARQQGILKFIWGKNSGPIIHLASSLFALIIVGSQTKQEARSSPTAFCAQVALGTVVLCVSWICWSPRDENRRLSVVVEAE
jgi:hypothetical protein